MLSDPSAGSGPAQRGFVVYASRYGSTEGIAAALARSLGWDCRRVDGAAGLPPGAPLAVGGPIYGFSVLPELSAFLGERRGELRGRPLFAFVVCGDHLPLPAHGEGGAANLEKLTYLLPVRPLATAVMGGRMHLERLAPVDRALIEAFHQRLGRPARDFDRTDPGAPEEFAARIRAALRAGEGA